MPAPRLLPKLSPQKLKIEAIAGLTTFFTMSYIIVVNPTILSSGTGISFSGAMTATVCLSLLMTLLMGLYAQLPFAVAPGMGINAFFTYSVIQGMHVPWPTALGMVFWSGVLFVLLSATPVRVQIASAIPHTLRVASGAGIGLFLTFIGLKNLGLVVADPATLVRIGTLDARVLSALAGLAIMVMLLRRKNPLAFLAGIISITALAWGLGWTDSPKQLWSVPDFSSVLLRLDLWGALKWAFVPTILSFLFTDLFDSISTFVGVSEAAGLTDREGQPQNLKEGLIVDAFATLTAALLGTSSGTAYIESGAGIEVGGRTGWSSVFTALCFVPFLFLGGLVSIVPAFATAPVLILVGALMFRSITKLKTHSLEESVPAYLSMVLIPLTFSITQGLLWGFVSHTVLFLLAGRRRELSPVLIGLAILSAAMLMLQNHS